MKNKVEIKGGQLFIDDIEIPFELIDKLITEELDKEVLEDLRMVLKKPEVTNDN
jgi:hypothetical protein